MGLVNEILAVRITKRVVAVVVGFVVRKIRRVEHANEIACAICAV